MFKARSFQYNLRGLLIGLTVFFVFLGIAINRANRQRDAIAELDDVIQNIEYDYQRPTEDAPIDYSREPRGWTWLRELLGGDYFDTVVGISLEGFDRPVSDRDVECLSRFTHLRYATIGGANSPIPCCLWLLQYNRGRLAELGHRNIVRSRPLITLLRLVRRRWAFVLIALAAIVRPRSFQ